MRSQIVCLHRAKFFVMFSLGYGFQQKIYNIGVLLISNQIQDNLYRDIHVVMDDSITQADGTIPVTYLFTRDLADVGQ